MKSGMKTQNIANFEAALIEAFDILSYVRVRILSEQFTLPLLEEVQGGMEEVQGGMEEVQGGMEEVQGGMEQRRCMEGWNKGGAWRDGTKKWATRI